LNPFFKIYFTSGGSEPRGGRNGNCLLTAPVGGGGLCLLTAPVGGGALCAAATATNKHIKKMILIFELFLCFVFSFIFIFLLFFST
jgi:hypothetical protein